MSLAPAVSPGEPMSWDEYARRGPHPPSEYIDGCLVMVPSPTREHQQICHRLANGLDAVKPQDHEVTLAWAWKAGGDEFIPDLMVHPVTSDSARFTGIPLLVVEVLSTNRADDLVIKTGRYAAAGALNYWIVDPRDRCLDAYCLDDGLYRKVEHADDNRPCTVPLGSVSYVVNLRTLLV